MSKKPIKYKSENGYSGVLYGKSSMAIYNPEGREVFHTGFRRKSINSLKELKEHVDTFPEFEEMLRNCCEVIHNEPNDDDF